MPTFRPPTRLPIDAFGTPDQGFATARVTSPYGDRWGSFHAALDIGNARLGDLVVACAGGRVKHAGYDIPVPYTYPKPDDGWWMRQADGPNDGQRGGLYGPPSRWIGPTWGGRMVVLDLGEGWEALYAHLGRVDVHVGDVVAPGQVLGVIGDSGSAMWQGHLHFGIHFEGAADNGHGGWVDPWPLINGAPHDHLEETVITINATPFPPTRWRGVGSITGYKPGAASKTVDLGDGSGADCDALVTFDPLPAGWPDRRYIRVINGAFAGYYIPKPHVTVSIPDPTAAAVAEATAGAVARAEAAEAALAAVKPHADRAVQASENAAKAAKAIQSLV